MFFSVFSLENCYIQGEMQSLNKPLERWNCSTYKINHPVILQFCTIVSPDSFNFTHSLFIRSDLFRNLLFLYRPRTIKSGVQQRNNGESHSKCKCKKSPRSRTHTHRRILCCAFQSARVRNLIFPWVTPGRGKNTLGLRQRGWTKGLGKGKR